MGGGLAIELTNADEWGVTASGFCAGAGVGGGGGGGAVSYTHLTLPTIYSV